METDPRSDLVRAGTAALANRHGRPFLSSIRSFVTALRRVPDAGPSEYSHEQLATIRDLAERVVAEIEDRLEDDDDHPPIQRELARTIYAIRRTLEEMHRWECHFSGRANAGAW
jgi:hypothetical protein